MAFDTFHQFARLPAELQDHIWDFAISSLKSHPSAHFFTIINKYRDMIPSTAGKTLGLETDSMYLLGPPRSGGFTRASWTEANLSGYMSEISLWNACGASRERMQTSRRTPENWSDWLTAAMDSKTSEDADELPILVGSLDYVSDQGTTVDPKSDLICLQPLDFDNTDWAEIIRPHTTILGTEINNLAFEFDPAWDSALLFNPPLHFEDTGSLRSVAEAASHNVHGWDKVWFIDYRIRRRKQCTPNVTRMSFNGNGCRFVEVEPFDEQWEVPRHPEPDTFRFLSKLETELDYYYDATMCFMGMDSPNSYRLKTSFGLLACERVSD